MKIIVNKREKIIPNNVSVSKLMKLLGYDDTSALALAIDSDVISKSDWDNKKLNEGDNITIIQATCGG